MNKLSIVTDWGDDTELRVLYIINVFTIKTTRLPIVECAVIGGRRIDMANLIESVLVGGMQIGVAC